MTTMIENISYWNNMPLDQLFEIDQLFGLNFDDNQNCTVMEDDNEETSLSSEIDYNQLQTSSSNNPSQQLLMFNLVCGVCGAPASGYNFDQITCESCKAFFRRNALRNSPNLKCRFTGSCIINPQTRRQCTYCRLKKCFAINMRKDWIRTEEEVELRKLSKEQKKMNKLSRTQQPLLNLPIVVRKKKRIMIKPSTQDLIVKPIHSDIFFGFNRDLFDEDRIVLNNITNAYQIIDDQADVLRQREWTPTPTLIQFLNRETDTHQSLINFYKSIPEFNQLDLKDRISLIKSNLTRIIPVYCILLDKFQENPLIGIYMSQWIGKDFDRGMSRAHRYFDRFIEHPLVLKLAIIVFIFSINLSAPRTIDSLEDYSNKTHIRDIQEFYTTVLWRYLNSLYEEKEAIGAMGILMTQILHYQTLINVMEDVISQGSDLDTINELESSLFRLRC